MSVFGNPRKDIEDTTLRGVICFLEARIDSHLEDYALYGDDGFREEEIKALVKTREAMRVLEYTLRLDVKKQLCNNK